MEFAQWLISMGCEVSVTQEDDGSGYVVLEVRTPDGVSHDITVTGM